MPGRSRVAPTGTLTAIDKQDSYLVGLTIGAFHRSRILRTDKNRSASIPTRANSRLHRGERTDDGL